MAIISLDLTAGQIEQLGLFIVIEGIDGAGKTTLARIVGERLKQHNISFFARKHVCEAPRVVHDTTANLADLLWSRGDCRDDNLLPPAFWLHLQAAWYDAYSACLLDSILPGRSAVIVDGWYYKFMAKLLLNGFMQTELDAVFSHARKPDAVILLDVDAANIWNRDRVFNQSELGLHQGYSNLGEDSFIRYQRKVFMRLRQFADAQGWDVVSLDPAASADANAAQLCDRLLRKIDHSPSNIVEQRSRGTATKG